MPETEALGPVDPVPHAAAEADQLGADPLQLRNVGVDRHRLLLDLL